MTAITALTAQNTVGVSAVEAVSPAMIREQVRAVASDIGVDAVKIGMLGDVATIEAVAAALDELLEQGLVPVVVDPVMVAESGSRLLADAALEKLIAEILPRTTVLTPNIPEAGALIGSDERVSQEELAYAVRRLGPSVVVVTGGHSDELTDLFFDGDQTVPIPGERYPGRDAHGSGCTHSSVLAAQLALGKTALEAAQVARTLAGEAVAAGLADIGVGPGPVNVLGVGSSGHFRATDR